jgi:hypothetical protein
MTYCTICQDEILSFNSRKAFDIEIPATGEFLDYKVHVSVCHSCDSQIMREGYPLLFEKMLLALRKTPPGLNHFCFLPLLGIATRHS